MWSAFPPQSPLDQKILIHLDITRLYQYMTGTRTLDELASSSSSGEEDKTTYERVACKRELRGKPPVDWFPSIHTLQHKYQHATVIYRTTLREGPAMLKYFRRKGVASPSYSKENENTPYPGLGVWGDLQIPPPHFSHAIFQVKRTISGYPQHTLFVLPPIHLDNPSMDEENPYAFMNNGVIPHNVGTICGLMAIMHWMATQDNDIFLCDDDKLWIEHEQDICLGKPMSAYPGAHQFYFTDDVASVFAQIPAGFYIDPQGVLRPSRSFYGPPIRVSLVDAAMNSQYFVEVIQQQLEKVYEQNPTPPSPPLSWWNPDMFDDSGLYLWAQTISQITPTLYISGRSGSMEVKALEERGIRLVIDLSNHWSPKNANVMKAYAEAGIHHVSRSLEDSATDSILFLAEDLLCLLQQPQYIAAPLLVHCQIGMSRAVSLAIAFLMHGGRLPTLTYAQAFALIQSKRPIIHPNSSFRHQLQLPDGIRPQRTARERYGQQMQLVYPGEDMPTSFEMSIYLAGSSSPTWYNHVLYLLHRAGYTGVVFVEGGGISEGTCKSPHTPKPGGVCKSPHTPKPDMDVQTRSMPDIVANTLDIKEEVHPLIAWWRDLAMRRSDVVFLCVNEPQVSLKTWHQMHRHIPISKVKLCQSEDRMGGEYVPMLVASLQQVVVSEVKNRLLLLRHHNKGRRPQRTGGETLIPAEIWYRSMSFEWWYGSLPSQGTTLLDIVSVDWMDSSFAMHVQIQSPGGSLTLASAPTLLIFHPPTTHLAVWTRGATRDQHTFLFRTTPSLTLPSTTLTTHSILVTPLDMLVETTSLTHVRDRVKLVGTRPSSHSHVIQLSTVYQLQVSSEEMGKMTREGDVHMPPNLIALTLPQIEGRMNSTQPLDWTTYGILMYVLLSSRQTLQSQMEQDAGGFTTGGLPPPDPK